MCTAATYKNRDHYFGRTLDLEYSYNETVTVTPRRFAFHFRRAHSLPEHYAMIGMAYAADGYPLYYEASNEKGLSIAGLNFPGNAVYHPFCKEKDNIAPFEFIPWILGQCAGLQEARTLLERINILDEAFSPALPHSPLHWIIADASGSITAEPVRDGLKLYDNPVGILTNNPPFDFHLLNLSNYRNLTRKQTDSHFAPDLPLAAYSRGMGAFGLPGDLSSASRFVRAAFVKSNAVSGTSETENVSQFFHILGAVEQQRGCVLLEDGRYEITVYTSCCNTDRGIYYYTTYGNSQISYIDMNRENLNSDRPVCYPLLREPQFYRQN